MLTDFDDGDYPDEIRADVCVIGSGAAGIALALELDGSGLDVVVIAGGAARHEAASQDLYRSRVVGLNHKGVHDSRARVHGGTTTLWAGQALPLDPMDFEPRDWVPHSGWPIRRDDLEPFYRRAERVLKIPPSSYDAAAWPPGRPTLAPFGDETFTPRISQFSRSPNLADSHHEALARSPNVRVLLHAHATDLGLDADRRRIEAVTIRSHSGRSARIVARAVVACCGAIETARLMLASDGVDPRGVGNAHDLVGRFFQDHLQGKTAQVDLDRSRAKSTRTMLDPFVHAGHLFAPRLSASRETQAENRILNACGGITYDQPEDSAIEAAKVLVRSLRRKELRSQIPRAIVNVARRPHEVAIAATGYLIDRRPMVSTRGRVSIGMMAEQAPNPASRITLDPDDRDSFGMRRSVVDWRLTALDRHTIVTMVAILADAIEGLGLGRVDRDSFRPPDDPDRLDESIFDCAHQIGTTRMHDDPRSGVVDRECRVHGLDNLFVASSSVFPTGGSSNPTLTILALTIRLADLLKANAPALPIAADAG